MSNSVNGKVALMTGGSLGLGAAVALALADEGVNQHRTLTPFAYPILTPLCCRSALGLPGAGRGCRG